MTSSEDYVAYVMDQARGPWTLRQRKMFGDYMVYVNDKPILLLCDDQTFIKIVPELDELMKDAEQAAPYPGAKDHYILDIDDRTLTDQVLAILEPITPVPKTKKRKSRQGK
jgi:TfoX/Sxy family transcriptional regulator of competence genes